MTGDLPYIAGKKTNYDRLHIISEHLHGIGKVAPQGAAPITVTAGGGAWTLGLTKSLTAIPTANHYLYLCDGATHTAPSVFTGGQFVIKFYGHPAL